MYSYLYHLSLHFIRTLPLFYPPAFPANPLGGGWDKVLIRQKPITPQGPSSHPTTNFREHLYHKYNTSMYLINQGHLMFFHDLMKMSSVYEK